MNSDSPNRPNFAVGKTREDMIQMYVDLYSEATHIESQLSRERYINSDLRALIKLVSDKPETERMIELIDRRF